MKIENNPTHHSPSPSNIPPDRRGALPRTHVPGLCPSAIVRRSFSCLTQLRAQHHRRPSSSSVATRREGKQKLCPRPRAHINVTSAAVAPSGGVPGKAPPPSSSLPHSATMTTYVGRRAGNFSVLHSSISGHYGSFLWKRKDGREGECYYTSTD